MNPAQICLRPANHEDVPFLLELRRKTMNAHLLASGLIPSLEEDMRRVLLRLDCAQIILLANQPVGLLGFGTRLIQSVITEARIRGRSLRLDVLKANPARRLYERLGFTVITEKAHIIEMRLKA